MDKNQQKNYQKNDNVGFDLEKTLTENQPIIYNENNKQKSSLSQKFIFGTLLFLGVGVLIYGFSNLSATIYGARDQLNSDTQQDSQVEQSNLIDDLLETQNLDTDKDGLSDYEESYIYKTSPYLPDTDSDGYLDKQEIDGGFDPLCPKGQECYGTQQTQENINSVNPNNENLNNTEIPDNVKNELKNLSPAELRQLMLDTGQLTEEELNQISDEDLMLIFNQVLGE